MKDAGSFDRAALERLFERLGLLLDAERREAAIVVVGGAALSLLGVVERRTVDIDVIATGRVAGGKPPRELIVPAVLPPEIAESVARLARDLGLPPGWMNATVTTGGTMALPSGFAERVIWRRYGGLWLGIAGRPDLIALKLHAAVDTDVRSRHFSDLLALRPTRGDLQTAGEWVRGQDAGPEFNRLVTEVIDHVLARSS